jgi:hypothetical protein
LTGVRLSLIDGGQTDTIDYAYRSRELERAAVDRVQAVLPQVDTLVEMRPDGPAAGYLREGFSFSPMFTLGIQKTIQSKGELRTWLKVEKAS